MSTHIWAARKAFFLRFGRRSVAANCWVARFSAAVIVTTACLVTCQAADKIRYDDIPTRLAPFGSLIAYRGINVITLDGKEHRGRRLRVESDHVRVFYPHSWEDLPSQQISRIEVSQCGRFSHHIVESAVVPLLGAALACGGMSDAGRFSPACLTSVTVVLSPVWAYTAVTTPFFLASDGVACLIPPKVYEIVH